MEEIIKKIKDLEKSIEATWGLLDMDSVERQLVAWREEMSAPDFWSNQESAVRISKQAENEEKELNKWREIKNRAKDLRELANEVSADDQEMRTDIENDYNALEKDFSALEFYVMFSGKYDQSNAILSIHSGTGGVDAQDWAQILERMYMRFAEKHDWNVSMLDRTIGNEAGIKSCMMQITGRWAYGYLRGESGVHRLVRISPFDAEDMRQTSFALVEVIPELPPSADVDIKEADLRIDVYRSSGPGGQSVNTTDSAVRIVHVPTGITVTCQTERSQHQNREAAMNILRSKLFLLQEEQRSKEEKTLRGETQKAEWGKQIRSYVMQPYKMVKDHRTDHETSDIDAVLDGRLDDFVEAYLKDQLK